MSLDNRKVGTVFNIQKFSVHDGPGIRTIVFLKGCPLICAWCSNPESQSFAPELAWSASRCMGCHLCKESCPRQAISLGEHGEIKINRDLCKKCFKCTDLCPTTALRVFGQQMSVEEVLHEVEADNAFYRRSKGGMTLSGGEALQQGDYAVNLLKEAKRRGIRTAVETCGFVQWSVLEEACHYLDTVIYDIKCLDSAKHKQHTTVGNELILSNFKEMCSRFPYLRVIARTPIIPGFNDTEEDVLGIINFIEPFSNVNYELLPYHRLGEPKYISLEREYLMGDVKLNEETFKKLKVLAKHRLGQRSVG
ncbi:glycyl-radical enzyme activating protein [Desulfoscipio sp. XC116]|uniref:(2S)-3-sulfopropanediol dehydratase activating enzyme n=1 Tax=Desulfoscipio sp. XC116 TaxID=3144975 RepID=UPI00325BA992